MNCILPVGNVGCGKSLLARKFAKMGHVICNMDTITEMIAGGEYGAYDNAKKGLYHNTETEIIESAFNVGLSVFVDRTNVDAKRRARFIEIARKYGASPVCYDFGPGDAACLERRLANPRNIPGKQWKDVFKNLAASYEKPEIGEGFDSLIEAPKKFRFYAFDFDGTIVENRFPEIGEIIDGTVEKMNRIFDDLSNIIIVWTCRSDDYENLARRFLLKNKIPFDFINENPVFDTGSRKIFAHEYFDNRNKNS